MRHTSVCLTLASHRQRSGSSSSSYGGSAQSVLRRPRLPASTLRLGPHPASRQRKALSRSLFATALRPTSAPICILTRTRSDRGDYSKTGPVLFAPDDGCGRPPGGTGDSVTGAQPNTSGVKRVRGAIDRSAMMEAFTDASPLLCSPRC